MERDGEQAGEVTRQSMMADNSTCDILEDLFQLLEQQGNNQADYNSSGDSHFQSCIKFNGVPILPPVLSLEQRQEMLKYKSQAIQEHSKPTYDGASNTEKSDIQKETRKFFPPIPNGSDDEEDAGSEKETTTEMSVQSPCSNFSKVTADSGVSLKSATLSTWPDPHHGGMLGPLDTTAECTDLSLDDELVTERRSQNTPDQLHKQTMVASSVSSGRASEDSESAAETVVGLQLIPSANNTNSSNGNDELEVIDNPQLEKQHRDRDVDDIGSTCTIHSAPAEEKQSDRSDVVPEPLEEKESDNSDVVPEPLHDAVELYIDYITQLSKDMLENSMENEDNDAQSSVKDYVHHFVDASDGILRHSLSIKADTVLQMAVKDFVEKLKILSETVLKTVSELDDNGKLQNLVWQYVTKIVELSEDVMKQSHKSGEWFKVHAMVRTFVDDLIQESMDAAKDVSVKTCVVGKSDSLGGVDVDRHSLEDFTKSICDTANLMFIEVCSSGENITLQKAVQELTDKIADLARETFSLLSSCKPKSNHAVEGVTDVIVSQAEDILKQCMRGKKKKVPTATLR